MRLLTSWLWLFSLVKAPSPSAGRKRAALSSCRCVWVVNAAGVTAAHLACISINPDTEQHDDSQPVSAHVVILLYSHV